MTGAPISLVLRLLRKVDFEQLGLGLRLWTGEVLGASPAKVTITLQRPDSLRLLMRPTTGRLASGYVEDAIDLDGDLRDVLSIGTSLGNVTVRRRLPTWFRTSHTRRSDRDAIQYHYDVSNDFYKLWLDRNMVYSCAYFRHESDSLDLAQEQKLDHICRKLDLQPGEQLLDIGCGWGGLILWAARHYDVHCVGITLSENQRALVADKIRELGLEDRCEVRLMDYRDLPTDEHFDKIVSVGMFEHVGRRNLRSYFDTIYALLKPGGLLLNHGIAASWKKGSDLGSDVGDFVGRYVFPGGELIHIAESLSEMEDAGLETRDVESLRPHYAKTLWHWVDRLDAAADAARQMVGDRAYRIWRIYMAGSAYSFERNWITLYQVLAGRPHADGSLSYPLTREHLYQPAARPSLEVGLAAAGAAIP